MAYVYEAVTQKDLDRELAPIRAQIATLARCISEIRTVTALPDVPLADLPGMIETLLSELADRQIQCDVEQTATPEQVYDDWAPEDTAVPGSATSCRGCLRLTEIDGRLMCAESRSRTYGASLHWPGPGCVWASAGDAIYGG